VKFVAANFDGFEFFVGHFDARGIDIAIEFAADRKSGFCCRGRDELDDHLMADKRLAAPVLGDKRK